MTIILTLLAVLVTVATTRAEIHETDYKQMVGTLNVLAICVQTSDAATLPPTPRNLAQWRWSKVGRYNPRTTD